MKTTNVKYPSAERYKLEKRVRNRCCMCYPKIKELKDRTYVQSHSLKVQTKCIKCDMF